MIVVFFIADIAVSPCFCLFPSTFRCKNGRRQWQLFWGCVAAAGRLAASLHTSQVKNGVAFPSRDCLALLIVVFCWIFLLLAVAPVSGVGCWALLFAVVAFVFCLNYRTNY